MSVTLEEAILHAEEAASDYEGMIEDYWLDSEKLAKCANEQRQIAEWLRELQAWRKAYDDCVNTDYESIDDSVRRLTIIGQVVNVRNVFADIRRTDDND